MAKVQSRRAPAARGVVQLFAERIHRGAQETHLGYTEDRAQRCTRGAKAQSGKGSPAQRIYRGERREGAAGPRTEGGKPQKTGADARDTAADVERKKKKMKGKREGWAEREARGRRAEGGERQERKYASFCSCF
jgi:hypothetical protein